MVEWHALGPLEMLILFRENGQIARAPWPSPQTTHYILTIVDTRDPDDNRPPNRGGVARVQEQEEKILA